MRRSWVVGIVGLVVAAAVAVVAARPAAAEAPTFVGGQQVTAFGGGAYPAISSNGSKALVVYQVQVSPGSYEVYGRLLSPDTTTIGSPFIIGDNTYGHSRPDVAWNGSEWLVVFQQKHADIDYDVAGQRVSITGAMVGGPFIIGTSGGKELHPAVTGGPNGQWAVVWDSSIRDVTYDLDIIANRVSADGVVLGSQLGTRVSYDSTDNRYRDVEPDIAWNGARYLVVWEGSGTGRRIDYAVMKPNGTIPLSTTYLGVPHTYPVGSATVASSGNGKDFLVAFDWNRDGTSTGVDVWGTEMRVNGDTNVSASSPAAISSQPGSEQEPDITWNGTYLLTWRDRRKNQSGDIYGTRMRPGFQVVDPQGFLITEHHKANGYPVVTKGTRTNQFAIAWAATPTGSGTGVIAYGMDFAAK